MVNSQTQTGTKSKGVRDIISNSESLRTALLGTREKCFFIACFQALKNGLNEISLNCYLLKTKPKWFLCVNCYEWNTHSLISSTVLKMEQIAWRLSGVN